MPLLIDRKPVDNDSWQLVEEAEALAQAMARGGDLLLPLALYLEQREALAGYGGRLGLRINGDDDLAPLLAALEVFSLVAIEFPAFRDGRGFSLARILRRAGFAGELRAVGGFARDQLGYLQRCGFNAFEITGAYSSADALRALNEISVHYQGCADDPRPIYQQH